MFSKHLKAFRFSKLRTMSSMRGWQPANTISNILSFAQHFETTRFITPPNRSQSASIKGLCVEEIHGSGPTLRSLGHLDINQLTLSQRAHDYSWGELMLSSYGPVGFPSLWEQSYIETLMPYEILEESSVLEYIQHAFFRRALCAALFLFISSTNSDMEPCPHPSGCNIVNQSSSGPSGWPDRQVVRRGNVCCLLEGKTQRACGTSERDVLEVLSHRPGDLLLYEGLVFHEAALENASTLQRKAITIVYQIWNRLLTRHCEHSVVANEDHFILTIRCQNTLQISRMYSFSDSSPASRRQSLTDLSFFIAHSLCARYPGNGTYSSARLLGLSESNSDGEIVRFARQGDDRLSHRRSDSDATVTSRTIHLDRLALWRWLINLLTACTFLCIGAINSLKSLPIQNLAWITPILTSYGRLYHGFEEHLLDTEQKCHKPFEVVFTTSGAPSTPLRLIPVSNAIGQPQRLRRLTLMTRVSDRNGLFSVFRGDLDGRKVITKMTENNSLVEVLRHESLVYQHLSDVQGSVIPTCLGLFTVGASYLLVMTDCGMSLTSFSTLTDAERRQLMNHMVCLHEHGVLHNDLEPRNVVIAGGELKLIDFGLSELGHCCSGTSHCFSLLQLKNGVS